MSLGQLAAFLLTQSSPVAAVEDGRTTVSALEGKLREGLAASFGAAESMAVRFAGPVFYLRPT